VKFEPIKLLKGSHANTGQTGLGCFMNVIAYLNGEPQITDESPCVCVTVRPIAVWLNDYMNDHERPQLLPFITRAMGSATMDKDTLVRRARLCADYAQRRAASAVSAAAWAERAATSAASAAAYATFDYEAHAELIADTLKLLDDMLPPATDLQTQQIERAQKLIELATA